MKRLIVSFVATLSIVIGLSVAGFAALSARVDANIPFDFMIGNKRLPAGKYLIQRGSTTGTSVIRGLENKKVATFMTIKGNQNSEQKTKLIFHRYGDQYFLAQVWEGVNNTVVEIPKSKAERKAAKAADHDLTQNAIEPEVVTVIAQVGQ
jgi:hypothetical protein